MRARLRFVVLSVVAAAAVATGVAIQAGSVSVLAGPTPSCPAGTNWDNGFCR